MARRKRRALPGDSAKFANTNVADSSLPVVVMMVVVMMMVMAFRVGQGGRGETCQKRECKQCLFHSSLILLPISFSDIQLRASNLNGLRCRVAGRRKKHFLRPPRRAKDDSSRKKRMSF